MCHDLYLNQVLAPHEQVPIPGKTSELSEIAAHCRVKNAFYSQLDLFYLCLKRKK